MLTIISVSYKSRALLEMNYRLVKALNPDAPFRWIVVQNTPEAELANDLAMDDPRFEMIRGAVVAESEKENIYHYSFSHAKALNLAFCYTDADLILTLDPDCFIFMSNWIELVSEHVKSNKIIFFGAPYHPDFDKHYQGFPTAILMMINRRQMNRENRFLLDFMPDVEDRLYKAPLFLAIEHHCSCKRLIAFFFKSRRRKELNLLDFPLLLREFFKKKFPRLFTEGSCDTGYQIYKRYRSSLKYETLPVFATDKRRWVVKLLESVLPNSRRLFPKNAPWITATPSVLFKEFEGDGYQFFWNGQFFAFHIQRSRYSEKDRESVQEQLLKKTEEFMSALNLEKSQVLQEFL